jgi:hypothetical protein
MTATAPTALAAAVIVASNAKVFDFSLDRTESELHYDMRDSSGAFSDFTVPADAFEKWLIESNWSTSLRTFYHHKGTTFTDKCAAITAFHNHLKAA